MNATGTAERWRHGSRVARPSANKANMNSGVMGGQRKLSSREICGKYVCALNQRLGNSGGLCAKPLFQTVRLLPVVCF